MTLVKLPALWLDNFLTSSVAGIALANQYPEQGAAEVAADHEVQFDLMPTAPLTTVDLANTSVWINGTPAMVDGVFQAGFITGSSVTAFTAIDQRVVVAHDNPWDGESTVTVRVVSQTLGGGYTLDESWTFTVEDLAQPRLVAAQAVSAKVVRLTFSEGMRRSGDGAVSDALAAANYAFTYLPDDALLAGVRVESVSVAEVSPTTFDVTVDMELSFWRTYRVDVAGTVADDSGNANAMEAGYTSAEFASWTPPWWPATRRFDLWSMLSEDDRTGDATGDLRRLISMFQDVVDLLLWDVDRFEELWDLDRAPDAHIQAELAGLGNPFAFPMTSTQARKLVGQLVASYKQAGTEPSIENLARFFLGLDVVVEPWNAADQRWILAGESVLDVSGATDGLGVDSVLGPDAGSAALYTFDVLSAATLTTAQRLYLTRLVEILKAPHEHFNVLDPTDVPEYDPWEINLSYLGVDTYVH